MKQYHKFVSPYLMWLIICVGIFIIFSYGFFDYVYYPNPVFYVLAGIALAYWIYFFMKGVTANLEASFRPHHITKLVTTGVYGKLRHPIYSADIILAWGIFFLYPTFAIFFSVIWATVILMVWVYLEEKALIEIFGESYKEYQDKVPMLFPLKRI